METYMLQLIEASPLLLVGLRCIIKTIKIEKKESYLFGLLK